MKNIVLIRHGQSLGQSASSRGQSRKHPDLIDCFLSDKGIYQAIELSHNLPNLHHGGEPMTFDLVCTSPLTRAVATCVLGLGHIPAQQLEAVDGIVTTQFICHPDLAEIGGSIPENEGRAINTVLRDVRHKLKHYTDTSCLDIIDVSLLPPSWPNITKSKAKNSVMNFIEWLHGRPEENIAIVCHFNVINKLLRTRGYNVENCVPITCVMNEGDLESLHLPENTVSSECNTTQHQISTAKTKL